MMFLLTYCVMLREVMLVVLLVHPSDGSGRRRDLDELIILSRLLSIISVVMRR